MYHNKLFLRSICQPLDSNAILNVSFLKSRKRIPKCQKFKHYFVKWTSLLKKRRWGNFQCYKFIKLGITRSFVTFDWVFNPSLDLLKGKWKCSRISIETSLSCQYPLRFITTLSIQQKMWDFTLLFFISNEKIPIDIKKSMRKSTNSKQ
jgi:hypothetical protein